MRHILFIGATDKTDLLFYISKVLATVGKRVLIVDATDQQKHSYSIPHITKGNLITEYDGFDVATGFEKQNKGIHEILQHYLKNKNERLESYEYILLDTDSEEFLSEVPKAPWNDVHSHVLITNCERFTIERNVEILEFYVKGHDDIPFVRVQYPFVDSHVKEDYLNSVLSHLKIQFDEDREFEFYYDEVNYATKVNNQFESRVYLKSLSRQAKKALYELIKTITTEDSNTIKAAFKIAEKGK
ncbi:hypothetical protein PPM_p0113 (plasmid) [Paenibacillus polymyxa M1]|uniref:hypothetical protein n=1 Tax=Paenibacillus polymyxa TaxID=1406 RepID=UPI00021BBB5D|nr:hypothetical protein [Paenibacillus polymyxa]CCC86263.1 hypothetical protein PPM_p0113 [Paenibacillus polymyxa M1]